MAKRMPSLVALLGLVAVAGYQNREKISEFVKGLTNDPNSAAGGMIDSVKKAIGSSPTATSITGGLGELVDQFTKNGAGQDSGILGRQGPQCSRSPIRNWKKPWAPTSSTTWSSRRASAARSFSRASSKTLPEAVDKLTPDGKIPA